MYDTILNAAKAADAALIEAETTRLAAPIEIIVAGHSHGGKTLIRTIIQKALMEAGFTNINLVDSEETPGVVAELMEKLDNKTLFDPGTKGTDEFLGKSVTIREVNVSAHLHRKIVT